MVGTIERDKDGKITSPVSAYNPPEEVRTLTERIAGDVSISVTSQYTPFTEFNDLSLLDRMDIDQKRWNAYRMPQSQDLDEAWRWNGVRPITRNKILGIVAQVTSVLQMPAPFAQNDKDELDRDAAEVMGILMEYNIRNSSYIEDYVSWVTESLVNPVSFLGVGFFEAMQKVRDKNGSMRDVVDDVISGFQTFNIPCDEVLIGNYHQKYLQKQRFIARRRYIDFDEAQAKWGDVEYFKEYVNPGVIHTFNSEDQLFY